VLGSIERKVLNMAIQQTKKHSDLEKRLSLLRQQVYGKQQFKFEGKNSTATSKDSNNLSNDTTYLYKDLSKIGILASIALGFQVILFFLTRNHLVNLKLF